MIQIIWYNHFNRINTSLILFFQNSKVYRNMVGLGWEGITKRNSSRTCRCSFLTSQRLPAIIPIHDLLVRTYACTCVGQGRVILFISSSNMWLETYWNDWFGSYLLIIKKFILELGIQPVLGFWIGLTNPFYNYTFNLQLNCIVITVERYSLSASSSYSILYTIESSDLAWVCNTYLLVRYGRHGRHHRETCSLLRAIFPFPRQLYFSIPLPTQAFCDHNTVSRALAHFYIAKFIWNATLWKDFIGN